MKTTFLDVRRSRFPEAIGACYTDTARIAAAANEVVQRLIIDPHQPETGWYGTWVPMVFNVTRASPYITPPRGIARLLLMDVCQKPIKIQNEFYEYLWAGNGLMPASVCSAAATSGTTCLSPYNTQAFQRGYFPTLVDVPSTAGAAYNIRVYPTNNLDVGKRILIQAYDQNGLKIYGLDPNNQQIEGFYITLDYPFVDSTETVGPLGIYGVQKDYTYGDVPIQAVETTTLAVTALARYEPGETRPWYPRYFLDSLPQYCCNGQTSIQINAMAKRDFYPVYVDTDWMLIGNIPALISEAQSIYHDGIQEAAAGVIQASKHADAIRFLFGELDHYQGKESPAVNVSIFGSAKTRYRSIGSLV